MHIYIRASFFFFVCVAWTPPRRALLSQSQRERESDRVRVRVPQRVEWLCERTPPKKNKPTELLSRAKSCAPFLCFFFVLVFRVVFRESISFPATKCNTQHSSPTKHKTTKKHSQQNPTRRRINRHPNGIYGGWAKLFVGTVVELRWLDLQLILEPFALCRFNCWTLDKLCVSSSELFLSSKLKLFGKFENEKRARLFCASIHSDGFWDCDFCVVDLCCELCDWCDDWIEFVLSAMCWCVVPKPRVWLDHWLQIYI